MSGTPKSLPARAAEYIRKSSLISNRDHVLAAVSGGPDSVALLFILINLKDTLGIERISVIHFDHRLRGDESDGDREFVRALARTAGLDFRCGAADVRAFARSRKISLEMAARECRRSFFTGTAEELNAGKIALGHTADDQAEEVILRILRGTGPAGIQGMSPATAEGIIRPLLFATRDAVLEYLQERGQEYRNDSTNFAPSCQRNFLRLKVFPLLREAFHPQIAQTIARCADLAREEESLWASQIRTLWGDICLELSEGRCALDFGRMKQLHPAVARRMLRLAIDKVKGNLSGVGLVHLEPLIELVSSGKTGKSIRIPGGIEATRHGAKLLISSEECATPKGPPDDVLDVHEPGNYFFGKSGFEFHFCDETKTCCGPDSGTDCIRMDSDKLKWPLQFRYRRTGDRFHPFGMIGSKKLQDYFTDCMVPRQERQKVPLLCDSEKICWVVGMRMDDRVKVEAHTRQILVVKLLRLSHNGEF
ncbi:MAG: tRNA lysidine(34) synthetase TilS [Syntrophobacteraceae bacterium]